MRSSALVGLVVVGLVACAKVETESGAPHSRGSGAGGTGSPIGAGGNLSVFQGSGATGGNLILGGSPAERPTYRRDCIASRVAVLSDGGSPRVHPTQTPDAAAPADGKDGGIDLKLGAGDLTVLVVFDKSGSMDGMWDARSKWQVANEALMKAIDPVVDNLTIGTIFFPQPNDCSVAPLDSPLQMNYAPGRRFASNWKATESSRAPAGSTPLELAFTYADMAVEQACGLGLLDDRFRVVLLTDGEPTCDDDTKAIVDLAGQWSLLGVETWVMGLPGSTTAAQLLDDIARSGGTQKAQMLGTPSALDHGLADAVR